jgi:hypothetical protein
LNCVEISAVRNVIDYIPALPKYNMNARPVWLEEI